MKKTKVYLQYPWKFPDSPYYKYLIDTPPKGIEYLNAEKQKGVITSKKFFWFSNFLKKYIRKCTRSLYSSLLNAHLSPKGDYDLIHCAHCLSKNTDKPWMADFEAFWQLWVSTKKTKRGVKKVERILNRKNCKKILPWTQKVYDEFVEYFPNYKDKFEIVFPAVPLYTNTKKHDEKITLLFVGRYFYWKGGLHALEIINRLTKKYLHVNGIVISEVPEEIKKKYSKNKKINILPLMPQKKVFEIYKKTDILVYPGYTDSFGFAFLEAMSFGIPIITVDGEGRKEIVTKGRTGFVIVRPEKFKMDKIEETEEEIIDELIEKTELLIENKILRSKMSKNCIEEIKDGKFSIKERNKKLDRIYRDALK